MGLLEARVDELKDRIDSWWQKDYQVNKELYKEKDFVDEAEMTRLFEIAIEEVKKEHKEKGKELPKTVYDLVLTKVLLIREKGCIEKEIELIIKELKERKQQDTHWSDYCLRLIEKIVGLEEFMKRKVSSAIQLEIQEEMRVLEIIYDDTIGRNELYRMAVENLIKRGVFKIRGDGVIERDSSAKNKRRVIRGNVVEFID